MKIIGSMKLTPFQLVALVLSNRILINFGFTPTALLPPANQDAWIVDLLTGVYIAILYIPPLFLANKFRNIFITDYYRIILGKWVGKILAVFISLYLLWWTFIFSTILLDFIKSSSLVMTPQSVLLVVLMLCTIFAAFKGFNVITKAAEIIIFYMLAIIIAFTLLGINKMDFSVFSPVLKDSNFLTINKSALFYGAGRFSDGVFFLVAFAFLDKKYSVNKTFFSFLIPATLIYILITLSTQSVLGIELTKHFNFPYFEFIKQINVFEIFQRIEYLNMTAWVAGFLFKLSAFTLIPALILKEVLGMKSEKPVVIGYALVVLIGLLISPYTYNVVYRNEIFTHVFYYISFFTFVVPFFVMLIYFMRRRKVDAEITLLRERLFPPDGQVLPENTAS
ncbi:endospore germination permease [Oscillospiraceae bacterium WX1]